MFEQVIPKDLPAIYALYQDVIAGMHARGLYQWTWGQYPAEDLLVEDVRLGRLFKLEENGRPVVVFAVCVGQDAEYDGVPWHFGVKPVCLHRIAISPTATGKGYARHAIAFTREQGRTLGCDCFRVDTYGQNRRALQLFASETVREAGTFRMPYPGYPDEFHCFEAPLSDTCPLLPVRMHPAYRYGDMTPWGGDALARLYGKPIPDARTGEALEISCIPGLESRDDMGTPLPQLIARSGAALTGPGNENPFPLLLKLLAAKTSLSVQVHPSDAYAMAHEHKLGKTEAWVILDAEPGAKLCYGMKPGVTLDALGQALRGGEDVEPMIATVEVSEGDVLYMPSGMVHAIGGGITLYEIQQSSDVTYRLWDFNRVNDRGEKRELHIEKSLDVIDTTLEGQRARLPDASETGVHTVLHVPAFTLECACVDGELILPKQPASFRMFTALAPMTLRWQGGALTLPAGQSAFLPAKSPALTLAGHGRALISRVTEA